MTDGGGGKAGNHGGDMGEGAERATLSSCGKRTATDKAGIYGIMDTTLRLGVSFGTRFPETFYEDFASILKLAKSRKRWLRTRLTTVPRPYTGPRDSGNRPESDGWWWWQGGQPK